jgi:hypothetical protein
MIPIGQGKAVPAEKKDSQSWGNVEAHPPFVLGDTTPADASAFSSGCAPPLDVALGGALWFTPVDYYLFTSPFHLSRHRVQVSPYPEIGRGLPETAWSVVVWAERWGTEERRELDTWIAQNGSQSHTWWANLARLIIGHRARLAE